MQGTGAYHCVWEASGVGSDLMLSIHLLGLWYVKGTDYDFTGTTERRVKGSLYYREEMEHKTILKKKARKNKGK